MVPLTRADWLAGALLVLAVVVTYLRAAGAGYIWDDDLVLTANRAVVGPLGLKEIWTTSMADICPLTLTTFWLAHALWGLAPAPYHLLNIVFHAGNAVVLWSILRRMAIPGAWLGAALWALHPVQVQSVAWIAEMKNTESGLFFLLSILFFLRSIQAGKRPGWDRGWTLVFAALAMAAKSSTIVLPVIVALCAWWCEGRWRWRHLATVGPMLVMAVIASGLSLWTQGIQIQGSNLHFVRTGSERLVAAGDAVWFYLGKLVWPHPLVFIYPRWQIETGNLLAWLPLLGVVALAVFLWTKRASWGRPWFLVFGCFLAALLPVLGLVDNYIFRYSLVFDHFQYLASMAPLALIGAGLSRVVDYFAPAQPVGQAILRSVPLLGLALVSFHQVAIYHDPGTLWTDTADKNPDCWVAFYNLALMQAHNGRRDEAMAHFQRTIELSPDYPDAYDGLGITLAQSGRLDEAQAAFEKAAALDPNSADAHGNLGEAFLKKRSFDEAISEFRRALRLDPEDADSACGLGEALLRKGEVDAAIPVLQRALQLQPGAADARENLVRALALRQAASR